MARTPGALPITQIEIDAARRLRDEDRLTWRAIGRILRREFSGLRKAVRRDDERSQPH